MPSKTKATAKKASSSKKLRQGKKIQPTKALAIDSYMIIKD